MPAAKVRGGGGGGGGGGAADRVGLGTLRVETLIIRGTLFQGAKCLLTMRRAAEGAFRARDAMVMLLLIVYE